MLITAELTKLSCFVNTVLQLCLILGKLLISMSSCTLWGCTSHVNVFRTQWNKLQAENRHNMPRPLTLTFDLLTLIVVSESRVTLATSVPILVFLGLSVLDLCPMNATEGHQRTDRQTDRRQTASLLNNSANNMNNAHTLSIHESWAKLRCASVWSSKSVFSNDADCPYRWRIK